MRKKTILLITLFLLIVILGVFFSRLFFELGAKTEEIVISDKNFSPKTLNIEKNTRVIFKNQGKNPHWPASDFHPTHGIYPEFDPTKEIPPGGEWAFIFKKSGKWKFHDHLVPTMKGLVIVEE